LPAETEAKVVLGDCGLLSTVEEKLRALGARFLGEDFEEDTYYQHPCRDFAATDEALRVRRRRGCPELTYKGPKRLVGGAKTRVEETVALCDAEGAGRVLEALGFRPVAVVAKRRRYYRLRDVLVSLDEVRGLGCFLEAEYVGAGGPGEAVEAIEEALRVLGLEGLRREARSYLELLLEARGRQGGRGV